MSYNIDTFKVKEINNLTVPTNKILNGSGIKDYKANLEIGKDGIKLFCGESTVTFNFVSDTVFEITDLSILGEGSGHIFENIIIPMLKETSGYLEGIAVWERGDHIERVEVDNGTIKRNEVL